MDEPVCSCCQDVLKRIAERETRVAEQTRKLEEVMRAGKRQPAPFCKELSKPASKNPGHKSGDVRSSYGHHAPLPGSVTESHQTPLPDACLHCHGPLVETGTAEQFHTEIPRQPLVGKFVVHLGRSTGCGALAPGRRPRMTSHTPGAISQIGPDAQAGLSSGKAAAVFSALFGITLARGACAQITARAVLVIATLHAWDNRRVQGPTQPPVR
jgi:transposase